MYFSNFITNTYKISNFFINYYSNRVINFVFFFISSSTHNN